MNTMERLKIIENYSKKTRIGDNTILYALVRCLDSDEVVKLLKSSLPDNLLLRNASLKIVLEHASESWSEAYDNLLYDIIDGFKSLPAKRRGSAFYCLGKLAELAPLDSREIVLRFLLSSRYTIGRRKGLSILNPTEIIIFRDDIVRCAIDYHEFKAVLILIDHFDPEYLFNNRKSLSDILDTDWAIRKLYLKAAEYDPTCIDELKQLDKVAFVCAKAKLNQYVPEHDIVSIIEEYRHDDRLGLLVWATGKMKYWDVLLYVIEHYEKWQSERFLSRADV